MIQFKNIQLVHEVGQRENNEDFVGYLDQAVYVLCDGVVGMKKGKSPLISSYRHGLT